MRRIAFRKSILSAIFALGLVASGAPAGAVTVLFTGNGAPGGTDQGIIGHDAVAAGSISHMSGPVRVDQHCDRVHDADQP